MTNQKNTDIAPPVEVADPYEAENTVEEVTRLPIFEMQMEKDPG